MAGNTELLFNNYVISSRAKPALRCVAHFSCFLKPGIETVCPAAFGIAQMRRLISNFRFAIFQFAIRIPNCKS